MTVSKEKLKRLLGLDTEPSEQFEANQMTYLCPPGEGPHPAVLYCHAHGGEYSLGRREVTEGARWLASPPAKDLLGAGFAVVCIDMPGFGSRVSEGTESALTKAAFWQGKPLFGQMIKEQLAVFNWLASQPNIKRDCIITLGTSMGAALAMWVAALEPRVAASVQFCMLADIAPMIEDGTHDKHGFYLTVPGLLEVAETGDIAGLIAPRPLFIGYGAKDHLTPQKALQSALNRVQTAYAASPNLQIYLSPDTGHIETQNMRCAALKFLADVFELKNKRILC